MTAVNALAAWANGPDDPPLRPGAGRRVAVLDWLEYRYLTRAFSGEIYIALIAACFTALGLWAGRG